MNESVKEILYLVGSINNKCRGEISGGSEKGFILLGALGAPREEKHLGQIGKDIQ